MDEQRSIWIFVGTFLFIIIAFVITAAVLNNIESTEREAQLVAQISSLNSSLFETRYYSCEVIKELAKHIDKHETYSQKQAILSDIEFMFESSCLELASQD